MGLMKDWNDPGRDVRARMERAGQESQRRSSEGRDSVRPRRYKLYDRIRDRVSVTTINVIIGATALLLVIALIIGIATGTPQQ